ncbi:MAG: hypothetical protein ABI995_05795 [Acidobacteriota bacterium]
MKNYILMGATFVLALAGALPLHADTLVGKQVRVDYTYPDSNTSVAGATVTVVDPGEEITCISPTSIGPACGVNINQGGYSIDLQANRILFQTFASITSRYGAGVCNCLKFTLLNPGQSFISSASITSTNIPGLVAANVTFTDTTVIINLGGLVAPANGSTDIAVQVGTRGPMTVTPPALSFTGFVNGPSAQKFLEVGATADGQAFTVSATNAAWLKVSGSGPAPQLVQVVVDPTGLSAIRYTANVVITAPGGNPSTLTVPVTYDVSPAVPPQLVVNPPSLVMDIDPRTHQGKAYLRLDNVGSGDLGPLTVTAVNPPEMQLQVTPYPADCSTRSVDNQVAGCGVTVTGVSAAPGTLAGSIVIKNRQGVVLKEVPVTQQVKQVSLQVLPHRYFVGSFADPTVGPPPVRQPQLKVLTLNNYGLLGDYTAFSTVPWLTVTPQTGPIATRATVEVNANASGLKPGGYYGSVVVRRIGAIGPPLYDEIAEVVMEVVPSTGAVRNSLDLGGYRVLIPNVAPSFTFKERGLGLAEGPMTVSANYRGGRAFFTVSPTSTVASVLNLVPITVTLASPAPPPGVYTGDVIIKLGTASPKYLTVVAVVPPLSASAPESIGGGREAGAACVPTKIVPVMGAPQRNFSSLTGWPTELDVIVVDDCGQFDKTGIVSAAFSNGDPPVFLSAVDASRWSGAWTGLTPNSNVVVTVTAVSIDGKLTGTATAGGAMLANPAAVPYLSDGGILNGASFAIGGPLSPGSFVTLFGSGLADGVLKAPSVPLPLTLAGASVQIGGVDTPVFFASDGQVNAIAPYGLPVDRALTVVAKRGDAVSVLRSVPFAAASPGIFSYGDQLGIVVGFNADGSQPLANADNPVKAQQDIVIYATGLGEVDPVAKAGSPTRTDVFSRTVNPVTVTVSGLDAKVNFAGLTPGSTGLYQVNAVVPAGIAPSNRVAVVLKAAGQVSAPAYISVK